MYTCINPGVYGGQPSGPPEFSSNNPAQCGNRRCMCFIDRDDDLYTEMIDGSLRCSDCRETCNACGEWRTDDRQTLRMRCYISGRLETWCRECAAEHWMEVLLNHQADEMALNGRSKVMSVAPRNEDPANLDRESIDALWDFYRGKR